MKRLLKLSIEFFKVCWFHGLSRAFLLVRATVRAWGFGIRTTSHVFPQIPSNSFSYLDLLPEQPLVSVVMPVYNSNYLKEAVTSVLEQSYKNFELVLVDDCSSRQVTLDELSDFSKDKRIKVIRNEVNLGISGATNVGIDNASGEYIGFMDHDDLIHPDALALFVRTLNSGEDADVYYSDEERIDNNGLVVAHMRKCQPSLDLLLSCNAVLHFCIMKKDAILKLGKLNSEYDGAQDHDLMLRALDAGMKFVHLPYVIYAWRIHGDSTSSETRTDQLNDNHYPKTYRNGKKLISDYLKRKNIAGHVSDDAYPWYRVVYDLPDKEEPVAILVPFKDKTDYLKKLLLSMKQTDYRNY
ncbi:MAG: glycosyltransferase, partial [Lentisphaerae bacterium]|nr:glycosyltransferase [Lentisphaerota bacterium]